MECGVIASLLWQRCAKGDMGMLAGYYLYHSSTLLTKGVVSC
jgi:hypothetical protein